MQRQKNKKIVIGVTGSFGSGKSTVAGMLRSYGARVLDADKIARQCIRRGSNAYKRIAAVFGEGIFSRGREIDRRKLAAVVFSDKALLKKLTCIVHPQVIAIIKKAVRHSRGKAVVVDAPLLIEAGLHRIVDKLVVVKISRARQLKRIEKKLALSRRRILERIQAQLPFSRKAALADFIIDNNGTKEKTGKQVKKIWRELWKN